MSLNKAMIIGNLGRDPEMRYTPSGTAVTQFSVAVNRNTRDEAGEWKKETEWFRVVLFREQAERAAEWLRKGTKVYIEGRIQTRQYEKDGQTHYMTELVAERFANLDPRQREDGDSGFQPRSGGRSDAPAGAGPSPGGNGGGSGAPAGGSGGRSDRLDEPDLDDLPF